MNNLSVVFSLETWFYSAGEESGAVDLFLPRLGVYHSAADAAANIEGIDIDEAMHGFGELSLFASDGSPLEARFSQTPYIDFDKNTYFPGVYSLHPGGGENLLDAIARIIARNENLSSKARIAVGIAHTNEAANRFGWPDTTAMIKGVERALQDLTTDMRARVVIEKYTVVDGKLHANIDDVIDAIGC